MHRIKKYYPCDCSTKDPKCPKCGRFITACKAHPSNFCDVCKVRLCWGCTHHCPSAVQCQTCQRYRFPGTFKRCEFCQEGFCLSCRNEIFDINIADEVCTEHKVKCKHEYSLTNFPNAFPKILCGQSLYPILSYRCQYEGCRSYACDGTIMEMEVKGVRDVRICHDHIFKCFSCEARHPMNRRGIITMYQEQRQVCLKCYGAWKIFIESLLILATKKHFKFSEMKLVAWLVMRRFPGRMWFN